MLAPKKAKPARKRKSPAKKPEPEINEFDQLLEPNVDVVEEPLEDIESLVSSLPEIEEPETEQESAALESEETISTPSTGRQFRELDLSDPETRLVVFVVAPKGGSLSGAHIQTVVERCGMEFGQMDLFHRFEDNSDHSPIQFTMSDVGEPGSFNIDTLANHETPAVTFFMSMTEPRDPSYAVDCMLATAETLAKALGGEMLDSDRSVMRPQTQEHYRELVKAYKLRSRAKSRRTRKSK
jgi:cell division protein ZipA